MTIPNTFSRHRDRRETGDWGRNSRIEEPSPMSAAIPRSADRDGQWSQRSRRNPPSVQEALSSKLALAPERHGAGLQTVTTVSQPSAVQRDVSCHCACWVIKHLPTPRGNGFCVIQAHPELRSAPCCPAPCWGRRLLQLHPSGCSLCLGCRCVLQGAWPGEPRVMVYKAFPPPHTHVVLPASEVGRPGTFCPFYSRGRAQRSPSLVDHSSAARLKF